MQHNGLYVQVMAHLLHYSILISFIVQSQSARILGVFTAPGKSQFLMGEVLMKELARRGHQVTLIAAHRTRENVENYRQIVVEGLLDAAIGQNKLNSEAYSAFAGIVDIYENFAKSHTDHVFNEANVKELLSSNATFDLVIIEQFFNDAFKGFAAHYRTPFVLVSSIGACEWSNYLVGNSNLFSIAPITFSGYSAHMTFTQRFRNGCLGWFDFLYRHLVYLPHQDAILRRHFPESPPLSALLYNASIILVNSHPSVGDAQSHMPAMVEVGGFHVQPQGLPGHLRHVLDAASDGVILFSMGSNVNTSYLSHVIKQEILKVFGERKELVLWKSDDDEYPEQPSNVQLHKWLPQQDVLNHPNVKLFISHGGLFSTIEAVYFGVPIIGIPIFGDQKMNIATAVRKGYAFELPYQQLNAKTLKEALNEVMDNPRYREEVQRRSKQLRDQQQQPMDKATYWIEYVLRHNGAEHLRSAALNLYFYQYLMLDVMLVTLVFLTVFFVLLKHGVNILFRTKSAKVKTS